jgi:transcriptional regulator GlxA family with amidase domain
VPVPTDHHLWIVAYDDMQALDLTGPHEVFATANRVADGYGLGELRYRLRIMARDTHLVATESGLRIGVDQLPPSGEAPDTLVVPGGDGAPKFSTNDPLVEWVGDTGRASKRLACVCTGAFIAASAGLLDQRKVTTHWARASKLARRFPATEVDPDAIYICDTSSALPQVWSSAGVTAGIDLALALVEADLGAKVAQEVARWLVVFLRRAGGQSRSNGRRTRTDRQTARVWHGRDHAPRLPSSPRGCSRRLPPALCPFELTDSIPRNEIHHADRNPSV